MGFYTKGNDARAFANEVALAASLGWISVVSPDGRKFNGFWTLTNAGLTALNHRAEMENQ